jgi:hypothetical protein
VFAEAAIFQEGIDDYLLAREIGRVFSSPGGSGPQILTPLELLDRLAALVPPPRIQRHRYFGVLARVPLTKISAATPKRQELAANGLMPTVAVRPFAACRALEKRTFADFAKPLRTVTRRQITESLRPPAPAPRRGS